MGVKRLFWKVNLKFGILVMYLLYKNKLILFLLGNFFVVLIIFEFLVRFILGKII